MNRRIVLLIVLLVLGGVAWWLSQGGPASTLDKPMSDFAVQDTGRVTRVFIVDKKGASVDLQRTDKGWMLNGKFDALQPQVDQLLRTFRRVEVRTPVPKSAEPFTLRVMAAASTKVEIYEGGEKPAKVWIVGHATKDHFGTYMVLEKPGIGRSSAPFVMGMSGFIGVLNTRFPTNPDEWRSTRVFRYPDLYELASVEVQHTEHPSAGYRIENGPKGTPKLTTLQGTPLPMDTTITKGALLPYRNFNFDRFVRDLKPASRDSLLQVKPNFIVKAKAKSGEEQEMKLWWRPYKGTPSKFNEPQPIHDPVHMYGLVQDSVLVLVQRRFSDAIIQPASAFAP